MSVSSSAPLFAKGSIEMQLAKGVIFLGLLTIIGSTLGLMNKAAVAVDTFSMTALGIATLASVTNLYAIVTLAAILYTKEKGNNAR